MIGSSFLFFWSFLWCSLCCCCLYWNNSYTDHKNFLLGIQTCLGDPISVYRRNILMGKAAFFSRNYQFSDMGNVRRMWWWNLLLREWQNHGKARKVKCDQCRISSSISIICQVEQEKLFSFFHIFVFLFSNRSVLSLKFHDYLSKDAYFVKFPSLSLLYSRFYRS